jgi:ABC-type nitrate/sulfonate/bicarbonate transport system substrate-binding protein
MLNRFMRATAKGWEYALNNPDEAAKITVEKYAPDLKVEDTAATIKATKELTMTERAVKAGLLSLDEEAWKQTIGELIRVGTLPATFTTADILDLTVYKK